MSPMKMVRILCRAAKDRRVSNGVVGRGYQVLIELRVS